MGALSRVVRYLISGGTAALVLLTFLYVFKEFFHLHYLLSSLSAIFVATIVGFILQKFWTFKDHTLSRVRTQITLYILLGVFNMAANTFCMYILVSIVHLHYFFSQIISCALLALFNFSMYRKVIFKGSL